MAARTIRVYWIALAALLLTGVCLWLLLRPEVQPATAPAPRAEESGMPAPVVDAAAPPLVNSADAAALESLAPQPDPPAAPDLTLNVSLPARWPVEVQAVIAITPRAGSEADLSPTPLIQRMTLKPGIAVPLPLIVPPPGLHVRLDGESVLPMLIELRWQEDGALRGWAEHEMREAGLVSARLGRPPGFDYSTGHPPVARKVPALARGAMHEVEVLPLVKVFAELVDGSGEPCCFPRLSWEAKWRPKATIQSFGAWCANAEARDLIAWVPVGAHVNVSADIVPHGLAQTRISRELSDDQAEAVFSFAYGGMRVGRVRVLSEDQSPLSDARFLFTGKHGVTGLLPPRSEPVAEGVHFVGLYAETTALTVWAPDHRSAVVPAGSVPPGGEHVDVMLARAPAALIVRVKFGEEPPAQRKPVNVHGSALPHTEATFYEKFYLPLPADGEIVLHADRLHKSGVRVSSVWYEFTELESLFDGALPVRRFEATRRTGVIVRPTRGWSSALPVVITAARELPSSADDQVKTGSAAGQSVVGKVGERAFLAVAIGRWKLRISQDGEPPLLGEAIVEVGAGPEEVDISPREGDDEWRVLKIVDRTGQCSAPGTVFYLGMAPLRHLAESRRQAVELAPTIASNAASEIKYGRKPKGRLEYHGPDGVGMLIAHEEGLLLVPSWLKGRVLVVPAEGFATHEGLIGSITVTVDRAAWAVSVSFSPAHGAGAQLSEEEWKIEVSDQAFGSGTDRRAHLLLPAVIGTANIPALPAGRYSARYRREVGQSARVATEVEFELTRSSLTVLLPAP